jgi:hypothetical protein
MISIKPSHARQINRRDDVLVSVCLSDLHDTLAFNAIERLAFEVEARFRFYEFIVLISESQEKLCHPLVQRVNNLRLFTVCDSIGYYQRRMVSAGEAIGDVVLMANLSELLCVDPIDLLQRAIDKQCAVIGRRCSKSGYTSFGWFFVFLGRLAAFRVDPRDLQTVALPRTVLNRLLSHHDPELALRFLPLDVRLPFSLVDVPKNIIVPRDAGLRRRLVLLEKLLVFMAPRLLLGVTVSSVLLAILGLLFGIYVFGVWTIRENVAAGWLTLSAVASLTAFFLGISITGLSLGLQRLLTLSKRDDLDGVAAEINQVDIFGRVASDLNIEFERGRADLQ